MNKKQVLTTAFILVLLFSAMVGVQFVRLAAANFLPPPPPISHIYIRGDGSVEPSTAPIQRVGNVYIFMNNLLNSSIEVQLDNVVIDGAGFILQGVGSYVYVGITLSSRSNVTIKNIDINQFAIGIRMNQSSNNIINGNKIYSCCGVMLDFSSNNQIAGNSIISADPGYGYGAQINSGSYNTIIGNNFTDTGIGVRLEGGEYNTISENHFKDQTSVLVARASHNTISKNSMGSGHSGVVICAISSYNTVFRNNITEKSHGIEIYTNSSSNTVYKNNLINNEVGAFIGNEYIADSVGNNTFYHNNFMNNTQNVLVNALVTRSNFWDNGKEGNYWSDYNGKDNNRDGVGDTPYTIDENNKDRYPLMKPFINPKLSDAENSTNPQTQEQKLGFLGSSLPMEYGYAIVTVIVVATVAIAGYLFLKSKKPGES